MIVLCTADLLNRNSPMKPTDFWDKRAPADTTSAKVWLQIAGVLILGWLSGCAQTPTEPVASAHIRFYSTNSTDQLSELSLVPNRDEPGCHAMPLDLEVHRVAQVGFAACQVYAEEGCPDEAALMMRWSGKRSRSDPNKNEPTIRITPGSLWLFEGKREIEVGSWRCEFED